MNKKERRLALATALQSAASDVVVVDDIKQAAGAIRILSALNRVLRPWGLLGPKQTAAETRQQAPMRAQGGTGNFLDVWD